MTTVNIPLYNKEKGHVQIIEVEAEIYGQIAVHADIEDPEMWQLTHIQSGQSIADTIYYPEDAIDLAQRLATVDLDAYSRTNADDIKTLSLAILREWRSEPTLHPNDDSILDVNPSRSADSPTVHEPFTPVNQDDPYGKA